MKLSLGKPCVVKPIHSITILLNSILRRGLVIIATSNREPEKLYENGLQRQNFVPFIPMLKSQVHEVNLDSGMDYRRSGKVENNSFFYDM